MTAEDGSLSSKAEMVKSIQPSAAGVSGSIKVTDFKVHVRGGVAVTTHVEEEHENYHGHPLHCQYRTTDTWIETPQGWRLIATLADGSRDSRSGGRPGILVWTRVP